MVPFLFRNEIYALACLKGVVLYLSLDQIDFMRKLNFMISIGFIIIIRLVAVKFKPNSPIFK